MLHENGAYTDPRGDGCPLGCMKLRVVLSYLMMVSLFSGKSAQVLPQLADQRSFQEAR